MGEQDWWLPRVAALSDLATERGIPHVYRVAPGAHEPAYWNAHVADYLRFYSAALSPSMDRQAGRDPRE